MAAKHESDQFNADQIRRLNDIAESIRRWRGSRCSFPGWECAKSDIPEAGRASTVSPEAMRDNGGQTFGEARATEEAYLGYLERDFTNDLNRIAFFADDQVFRASPRQILDRLRMRQ